MKCEIRYIEHKFKEEYKTLTIDRVLFVIIASSVTGIVASFFLEESTLYIILVLFFMILIYLMCEDAVSYCRNRKIVNENVLH